MESDETPTTLPPEPTQNKKCNLEICLVVLLLLIGASTGVCLYFGHPSEYIWFPKCPFRVATGLLCPGCGALRATHYLLNGQWGTAFRYQPLLVLSLPILALLTGKMFYENLRKTNVALPFELHFYWLLVIIICLFFVLRNVPLDCFNCLRPPVISVPQEHPATARCTVFPGLFFSCSSCCLDANRQTFYPVRRSAFLNLPDKTPPLLPEDGLLCHDLAWTPTTTTHWAGWMPSQTK